jgi:hypothetical protein
MSKVAARTVSHGTFTIERELRAGHARPGRESRLFPAERVSEKEILIRTRVSCHNLVRAAAHAVFCEYSR